MVGRVFRIAAISIFVLVPVVQGGVNGKVHGVVTDAETGEPLVGVNVIIDTRWEGREKVRLANPLGAATDANGYYFILNVPPGRYDISARMIGYETKTVSGVRVEIGRTATVDFHLNPSVVKGKEVVVTARKEVVKLDVPSSRITVSGDETENLPTNDLQHILDLAPGVTVNTFNNKISIRGGGPDQVMTYLDGFALKDNIFNIPFLSFNRTAIEEISIETGGFSAEYGDLRSGIINVATKEGGANYAATVDIKYHPPGYKYTGPKKYIEDKYWLMYGSDISFDSTRLHRMFPNPQDRFDGWIAYAEQKLADSDSSNDWSPYQRRELWRWRHRGRREGHLPDVIFDGTLTGPFPGRNLPLVGPVLRKMNFMVSHRNYYYAYEHPAYRDHYLERNSMVKIIYRFNPAMRLTFSGMFAHEYGMAQTARERGNDAYVMRSGGGGSYGDCIYNLGDIYTKNIGLSFVHTLSPSTFYEIRINQMSRRYDIRHGPERDTTKVKFIPGEIYTIQSDSLEVPGVWDPVTHAYIRGDTVLHRGDKVWCGPSAWDETPEGWVIPGEAYFDQPGKVNLNASSPDLDHSKGSGLTVRFDLTSQVSRRHQIKTGLYYNTNMLQRDWYEFRTVYEDRAIRYKEYPRYGAFYVQDRVEAKGLIGNFGVRVEMFDANSKDYEPGNPFSDWFFIPNVWSHLDSMDWAPSKVYWRVSPRLGISHPMTAESKIYFNYGHAYNAPSNTYRYGFLPHTFMNSRMEWRGNPNLKPQKTVQYELGYEHAILGTYLIHTAIYYKDVSDELGKVFYQNVFSPDPTARYYTWENKVYEDIIGWEFRLYKRVGDFVTGWIQTEFRGQNSGEIGYKNKYVPGDPYNVSTYAKFSYPHEMLWDWTPNFLINLDLHTPYDYGPTWHGFKPLAGWRLNAILFWQEGAKFTWNPEHSPFVRNNLQYANTFTNSFYVSKAVGYGWLKADLYLDVRNLFARRLLNVGVLTGPSDNPGSEQYKYFASLKPGDRVGHWKKAHIVRPKEKPGENYIYRTGGPILVYFGVRLRIGK